jgi:hypothetical protein
VFTPRTHKPHQKRSAEKKQFATPARTMTSTGVFVVSVHKPTQDTPLGIVMDSTLASPETIVRQLDDGSPLRGAGLLPGDILLAINGETCSHASQSGALLRAASGDIELIARRPADEVLAASSVLLPKPIVASLQLIKCEPHEPLGTHFEVEHDGRTILSVSSDACGFREGSRGMGAMDVLPGDRVLNLNLVMLQSGAHAEWVWAQAPVGRVPLLVEHVSAQRLPHATAALPPVAPPDDAFADEDAGAAPVTSTRSKPVLAAANGGRPTDPLPSEQVLDAAAAGVL